MSFKFCAFHVKKPVTLRGREYSIGQIINISDSERLTFACDDDVMKAICDESIVIMNGVGEVVGISNQISYLKDFSQAS